MHVTQLQANQGQPVPQLAGREEAAVPGRAPTTAKRHAPQAHQTVGIQRAHEQVAFRHQYPRRLAQGLVGMWLELQHMGQHHHVHTVRFEGQGSGAPAQHRVPQTVPAAVQVNHTAVQDTARRQHLQARKGAHLDQVVAEAVRQPLAQHLRLCAQELHTGVRAEPAGCTGMLAIGLRPQGDGRISVATKHTRSQWT